MNSTYEYRKKNGLCVTCGDMAEPGRTKCIGCYQVDAIKRMQRMEDEEYRMRYQAYQHEYQKSYRKDHPKSKEKNAEYNRRYREKNPTCTFANKERWFRYNGEKVRLPELAKKVGIPYQTMYNRVFKQGLSLSEAIIRG